jgi:hypothetical protein
MYITPYVMNYCTYETITFQYRGCFKIHDVPKWWRYCDVWSVRHIAGTFYHVRYRHIMFLAFGTYVATPCLVSRHKKA